MFRYRDVDNCRHGSQFLQKLSCTAEIQIFEAEISLKSNEIKKILTADRSRAY